MGKSNQITVPVLNLSWWWFFFLVENSQDCYQEARYALMLILTISGFIKVFVDSIHSHKELFIIGMIKK